MLPKIGANTAIIVLSGSSTINNCTITINKLSIAIQNESEGNIEIVNSTIERKIDDSDKKTVLVKNIGKGTITIKESNITTKIDSTTNYGGIGIENAGEGKVELLSGTVSIYGTTRMFSTQIKNTGKGTIDIKGGTIGYENAGYTTGIENTGEGTINITGGSIKTNTWSSFSIINNMTGTVNISEEDSENNPTIIQGIITNSGSANPTLNISGGTISYSGGNNSSTIYNYIGTTNIIGGRIESNNISNCSAIRNQNGNVNISGNVEITGQCGKGTVYQNGTGKTIIGTQGEPVSIEMPSITSTNSYGIYNENGTIEFYDGIIRGKTNAKYGNLGNYEEGYDVIIEQGKDEYAGYEIMYLALLPLVQVGEDETNTYRTIEEAIEACPEGTQTTMKLLRKVSIGNTDIPKEIPNQKDIIFDLNNNQIDTGIENTFINNGKFEIKNGKIIGTTNTILYNKGESAKINNITATVTTGIAIKNEDLDETTKGNIEIVNSTIAREITDYENTTVLVKNTGKGTITIKESNITTQIDSTTNYGGIGIENSEEGKVELLSGTVSIYGDYRIPSTQIKNTGKGTIDIKGGTIGYENAGYTTGIENTGEGTVNITGGSIKANAWSSDSITNNMTGTINISEEDSGNNPTIIQGIIDNSGSTDSTLNISGGTISYSGANNGSTIHNYNGTTNITGGRIESNNTLNYSAIRNQNGNVNISGNVEIIGQCEKGIVYQSGTGKTIIGTQGEPVSIEMPSLTSTNLYGIYNENGTIEFYDGIIRGKTNVKYGKLGNYEDGYDIIIEQGKDEYAGYEIMYLGNLPLVQVGEDETNTYRTIEEAIEACPEGTQTTMKLLRNALIGNTDIPKEIPNQKDIILDLNNYKIDTGIENAFINNGKFEIKNGKIIGTTNTILYNKGESTKINNITATVTTGIAIKNEDLDETTKGNIEIVNSTIAREITDYENTTVLVKNTGKGTITIKESNITTQIDSTTNYGGIGIENAGEGKIELLSGTVSIYGDYRIPSTQIKNTGKGTVDIKGGTVGNERDSYTTGIENTGEGTINITGGSIKTNSGTINNSNSGTINISEEDHANNPTNIIGVINNGGIANVSGGNIKGTINNYNNTLTITDGEISSSRTTIYNQSGNTNIEGGNITTTSTDTTHAAIYNNLGTTNIKNATIRSSTNGIYIYDGAVNIGTHDSEYNDTNPSIVAEKYGIYVNGGETNFYDGTIKGKEGAIYGNIYSTEDNFKTLTQIINGYEQATLTIIGTSERVVGIDDIYYTTLQSAINICPKDNTQKTIVLYKTIELSELVTVSAGKNIVISLNGWSITYNGTEITNANKSTAFIIDSGSSVTITN